MTGERHPRSAGSEPAHPVPVVRPAIPTDARTIAEIRVASWRATYAGIVPLTILDRLDVTRIEAWIAGRIVDPQGRGTFVIEQPGGTVAGYALTAPTGDEDAVGLGEVEAIYLAPDARGHGLGLPLLEAAVAGLAASGFETVILWVLTANGPARRFNERAGFRPDGGVRVLDFDGMPVEEIRYRRADSG